MARTPSTMSPLGIKAPDFQLPDTLNGNKDTALNEIKGEKGTLVMFTCNHCPFVLHVNDELVRIGQEYIGKGIGMAAISSNDIQNYPQDAPALMTELGNRLGYSFPYLYDETQEVAKAYDAACTPDFFLYDSELNLVYRGQLDDSRPGNSEPVNGKDLRAAMEALIAGQQIDTNQRPTLGCNIKWK